MATTAINQLPKEIADRLTPKQRKFCQLVVATDAFHSDKLISAAYRKAGFSAKPSCAGTCGRQLLRTAPAEAYVKHLRQLAFDRAVESMSTRFVRTLQEREDLAYSNMADLFEESADGTPVLKSIKKIPKHLQKAIKEVRLAKDGETIIGIKMADKNPHLTALETRYSHMPSPIQPAQKLELSGSVQVTPGTRSSREKQIEDLFTSWDKNRKTSQSHIADVIAESALSEVAGPAIGTNGHV